MALWCVSVPEHIFPFAYSSALCTDLILASVFVQTYANFSVNTVYFLEYSPGRNPSPAPTYSIAGYHFAPRCNSFCFYVPFPPYKRCQEAVFCPSSFTYLGLNNTRKDFSASNTKRWLFIQRAVTSDGRSRARISARLL